MNGSSNTPTTTQVPTRRPATPPKPPTAAKPKKPKKPKKKATKKPTPAAKVKPTKRSAARKATSVATTTRTGKKIRRTKAGGKGVLAAKGVHLLVVRVPEAIHAKVWAKARAKEVSLSSWLNGVIARAAT